MSFSGVAWYLTEKQKQIFQSLESDQKLWIEDTLDRGIVNEVTKIRLILNLIPLAQKTQFSQTSKRFFTQIISNVGSIKEERLKELKDIFEKEGYDPFFQHATTRKTEYYSIETLSSIIEQFYKVFEPLKKGASIPRILMSYPSFEEADKYFLQKIQSGDLGDKFRSFIGSCSNLENIKSEAKIYLATLPEAQRASMQLYADFFKWLHAAAINKDTQIVIIKSIVALTSHPAKSSNQKYTIDQLQAFQNAALKVKRNCGDLEFFSICKGFTLLDSTYPFEDIVDALKKLEDLYEDLDLDVEKTQRVLKDFEMGKIQWDHFLQAIRRKNADTKSLPEEGDVQSILERFKGDGKTVLYPLPKDKLALIKTQYAIVTKYCEEWKDLSMDDLVQKAKEISHSQNPNNEESILKLVSIGRLSLRYHHHYPNSTQVLTVLAQLSFEKGCFAQMKTGEGKTITFTLMAFVLAMLKKEIHIISSSESLSIRDQKRFAPFFKTFNIQTSHICKRDWESKDFQGQILYGTPTDFMFAIMEEMLYFKKLFPTQIQSDVQNRCALIDEVDNLILDTAENIARLCLPLEYTGDWVYIPILTFVKENCPKTDCSKLNVLELKKFLSIYQDGKFSQQLKPLSDEQLNIWLESAYEALFFLEENKDYIVREDTSIGKNPKKIIEIVDKENTGKIQTGMRWGLGIHEFVEAKHGLEIRKETLAPISLSVPVLYQKYHTLFGLTGTMGHQLERDEMKNIYGIDSFDVPTYHPSLRKDLPTLILPTEQAKIAKIIEQIKMHREQKRPTLILCYTIQDTQELGKEVSKHNIPFSMLNEIQLENADDILERAGKEGAVTIATNNAGRGVDIILKDFSEKNGGLATLFGCYPDSLRVEDQGRGRSGRQGQQGSSQIILSEEHASMKEFERKAKDFWGTTIRRDLAEKERFAFSFVEKFYSRLFQFHSQMMNDTVLQKFANILGPRKIIKSNQPDLTHLSIRDQIIAKDALALLTSSVNEEAKWFILLKVIAERLEKKVIDSWAISFSHKTQRSNEEFDEFKTKCEKAFQLQQAEWDKYLRLDGEGILTYLREVTGASLKMSQK